MKLQNSSKSISNYPSHKELRAWFKTPLGKQLLAYEQKTVASSISRYFGYHQLEVVLSADVTVGEDSLLGHRILAVPEPPKKLSTLTIPRHKLEQGLLPCKAHELPIASETIDLVILHHTLDITEDPHQTLREAYRVLRSGGHIVIVGFNPLSIWGARKFLVRSKKAPWSGRFMVSSRLEDWLNLLDFRVNDINHRFFMPPISNVSWLKRFSFLEKLGQKLHLPLGAFYTIQAQKSVACTYQIRPSWKRTPVRGAAVVHQFTPVDKK